MTQIWAHTEIAPGGPLYLFFSSVHPKLAGHVVYHFICGRGLSQLVSIAKWAADLKTNTQKQVGLSTWQMNAANKWSGWSRETERVSMRNLYWMCNDIITCSSSYLSGCVKYEVVRQLNFATRVDDEAARSYRKMFKHWLKITLICKMYLAMTCLNVGAGKGLMGSREGVGDVLVQDLCCWLPSPSWSKTCIMHG